MNRYSPVIRTFVLMAGLTALLLVIGNLIGGSTGLIIAAAIAVAINAGAWFFSDRLALRGARAVPLAEADAPQIYAVTRRLCDRAGIPMPRLYLSPSPQPNAFASGRSPRHAVVCLTQGLLTQMPPDEVEAVIAHELGHIRNRDILIMSVAAAVAGSIAMIADWLMWSSIFGDGEEGLGLIGTLAVMIIAPIAAMIIQLAISRQREFVADRTAAELMGTPRPLASALGRLEHLVAGQPVHVPSAQAPLYIANPLAGGGIARLFSTHPPMAERIARLESLNA